MRARLLLLASLVGSTACGAFAGIGGSGDDDNGTSPDASGATAPGDANVASDTGTALGNDDGSIGALVEASAADAPNATDAPVVPPVDAGTDSPPVPMRFIFATDLTYSAMVASVVDCTDLANTAGLPGTYVAWLSTGATPNPADALTEGIGWYLPNGTLVAASKAALVSNTLAHAINRGTNAPITDGKPVWTGTDESGMATTADCAGWTVTVTNNFGTIGLTTATDYHWSNAQTLACNNVAHLYCVQQ